MKIRTNGIETGYVMGRAGEALEPQLQGAAL
jgi:hypothetical protein